MQFSTHYIWQSAFSIKYKVKVNGVIGKWKKVLWNVSNMCHKTCILKSVSKKIDSQLTLSQKNITYMSISCLDFMWHKYKSIQFVFFSGQTLIILHSLTFCNCYWTQNSYFILWILSEVQYFQFRWKYTFRSVTIKVVFLHPA